jgi:putative component of toxin-antitoxin plasmid stabilization module
VPSQVRIISRRNSGEWDKLIRDAMAPKRIRSEHDYFGITNEARAETVRKNLRTAGRHQGVGSRVYYQPCNSPGACRYGGPECAYHVKYTVFPLDEARAFKAAKAQPQG